MLYLLSLKHCKVKHLFQTYNAKKALFAITDLFLDVNQIYGNIYSLYNNTKHIFILMNDYVEKGKNNGFNFFLRPT